MKIYLASGYHRRGELQHISRELEDKGFHINARWLTQDHTLPEARSTEAAGEEIPRVASQFAVDDYEDIKACNVFILFSERADTRIRRGGSQTELGMAIALGKFVIVIGPRQNVFHCLRSVRQIRYFTFTELLSMLEEIESLLG